MSYRVRLLLDAAAEWKALSDGGYKAVDDALEGLTSNPRPSRSKVMDDSRFRRLAVRGDWRIIYFVCDGSQSVSVTKIGTRKAFQSVYDQLAGLEPFWTEAVSVCCEI